MSEKEVPELESLQTEKQELTEVINRRILEKKFGEEYAELHARRDDIDHRIKKILGDQTPASDPNTSPSGILYPCE